MMVSGMPHGRFLWCAFFMASAIASPPHVLAASHRLYVADIAKAGDSDLRKELLRQLSKSKDLQLVQSPAQADEILTGSAELYIRGYYSLYVRAGSAPSHGRPLYGGFASVVLKSRSGETLWSYLATLQESTSTPGRELSRDIARHLIENDQSTSKKP